MRKTLLGLIAAAAIVTSMSPAAMADSEHVRYRHARQITEATRNAYGSVYEQPDPGALSWTSPVHAGNHTEQFEDPRTAVNGN